MSGGADTEGIPEAEVHGIEVSKVLLPNGNIKANVILDTDSTVMAEKETILRDAQIPYPILYVMVVHGPGGSIEVLDDSRRIESYSDVIGTENEIHIVTKNSQVERPPRKFNPEMFNVALK